MFEGYHIKVNGIRFPSELLAKEGYKSTPNQRSDKDSYTDGAGALHRNILPVKRSTVKITTLDGLSYNQKLLIKSFFIPRDVITMTYWNEETDSYKTSRFYVPDFEYVQKYIIKGSPIYKALELTFIAYEGDQ